MLNKECGLTQPKREGREPEMEQGISNEGLIKRFRCGSYWKIVYVRLENVYDLCFPLCGRQVVKTSAKLKHFLFVLVHPFCHQG